MQADKLRTVLSASLLTEKLCEKAARPTCQSMADLFLKLLLALVHFLVVRPFELKNVLDSAIHVATKPSNGLVLVNVNNGFAMWRLASNTLMYMH